MCLAVKFGRKFTGSKGYKLLRWSGIDGSYTTGMNNAKTIPISMTRFSDADKDSVPMAGWEDRYPGGFHIFTKRKDAERILTHYPNLALCKVGFKNQIAYGEVHWHFGNGYGRRDTRNTTKTVVAQRCTMLEVIKEGREQ